MGGVHLEDGFLLENVDKEGGPDFSLAVEQAGGSSLSRMEPFDIMGQQIMQEFGAIGAPDGEEFSREFREEKKIHREIIAWRLETQSRSGSSGSASPV